MCMTAQIFAFQASRQPRSQGLSERETLGTRLASRSLLCGVDNLNAAVIS